MFARNNVVMNQSIKYLALLFLAFSSLTFQSCDDDSSEDDFDSQPSNTDPAAIVGEWEMISFEAETVTDTGQGFSLNGDITGSNFDYVVTFAESTFTTSGSYTISAAFFVGGFEVESGSETYTDVSVNGDYTAEDGTMTTSEPFFTFQFQGMDFSDFVQEQTFEYSLSDDGQTMTFTQSQLINETVDGVETSTQLNSTTVLQKL